MEMEEIVKILIALVVMTLLIGAVFFLFSEKGGTLLESMKNLLKFGN